MEFLPRDFELLHMSKIKLGLDRDKLSSQYFFCLGQKMIFVKKSRDFYKICCSCQCGFNFLYRESVFDVVFSSKDLVEVIHRFYDYCYFLLKGFIK